MNRHFIKAPGNPQPGAFLETFAKRPLLPNPGVRLGEK